MQGCSHGGCRVPIERSEDQARPSSSTCSLVRFPQPEVAGVLSVSTSQGTASSQLSVVSTSQGNTSRPSACTSQGTTSSMLLVRTVRETNTSMSSGRHHGGGRRGRQCKRRRRCRNRSGNDDLEKAPKFETVVRPREQQIRVEITLLDSLGPAIAYGSSGTQCPIPNCSGDGSKRHAFECHLQRRTPWSGDHHSSYWCVINDCVMASWRTCYSPFVSELFSSYGCRYYI